MNNSDIASSSDSDCESLISCNDKTKSQRSLFNLPNNDDDDGLNEENPFDGAFEDNSFCSTISELLNFENDRSFSEIDFMNEQQLLQNIRKTSSSLSAIKNEMKWKRASASSSDSLQLLTNDELQQTAMCSINRNSTKSVCDNSNSSNQVPSNEVVDHTDRTNKLVHNSTSLVNEIDKLRQKVVHSNQLIENLECGGNCQQLPLIAQDQPQIIVVNNVHDFKSAKTTAITDDNISLIELEKKHRHELENLRKYYEKKCMDLEKSFSEEIFNQKKQSRRDTDSDTSITETLNSKNDLIHKSSDNYEVIRQKRCDNELESFREDYECRLNVIKLENDNLKKQVVDLQKNLDESRNNEEICRNQKSQFENQLHDVKFNLIQQLEQQIKNFLQSEVNDNADTELPNELIMLGRCFTEKLKQSHEQELESMRRQLQQNGTINDHEKQLISTMKIFIKKLIGYLYECENELNESLIDEMLQMNLSQSQQLNDSMKRIHFTPDLTKITDFLNKSLTNSNFDLSFELNSELKHCLNKFKSEANEILLESVKLRAMLNDKESLKNEIDCLMVEKNQIVKDLNTVKNKKVTNSCSKKFYQNVPQNGVDDSSCSYSDSLCSENLHNKVQMALSEKAENNKEKFLIRLVDDLNKELDKYYCEKQDFKLQNLIMYDDKGRCSGDNEYSEMLKIEAFGKKLKISEDFLNQQIIDHENEHDDWQKERLTFTELLAEKDKEISNCRRLSTEIRELEDKRLETIAAINEAERKNCELENGLQKSLTRNSQLEKDVQDLKNDLFLKETTEKSLMNRIDKLQNKLKAIQDEKQGDADSSDGHICECDNRDKMDASYVLNLEKELQQYKTQLDVFENEAITTQLKFQLKELEIGIENRTNELENVYVKPKQNNDNSITASEEISINEQVKKSTQTNEFTFLDILRNVIEKWRKHLRVEQSVMESIQGLEFKIVTLKNNEKQLVNDRETLQNNLMENGILISTLQLRLDQQRTKIEEIQKDRNSGLLSEISELKKEIAELNNDLIVRQKEILKLKQTIDATSRKSQELYDELKSTDAERKDALKKCKDFEQENVRFKRLLEEINMNDYSELRKRFAIAQLNSDDEMCTLRRTAREYSVKSNDFIDHLVDHKVIVSTPNVSDFEKREMNTLPVNEISPAAKRSLQFDSSNDIEIVNKSLKEKCKQISDYEKHVKELENVIKSNLDNYQTMKDEWKCQEQVQLDKMAEFECDYEKLQRDLFAKENIIAKLEDDLEQHQQLLNECNDKIKLLENVRDDKEIERKQFNATIHKLENQIEFFRKEMGKVHQTQTEHVNGDQIKLEIAHLKNMSKKKDDIICKLNADCKNVRYALELIRKKFITNFQLANSNDSLEEINDKVKKQLNYSQNLDESILNAIEMEPNGFEISGASSSANSSSDDFNTQSDEVKRLKIKLRRERVINNELLSSNKSLIQQFQLISDKFEKQRACIKDLKQSFETEKRNFDEIRNQDANLLQNLEIRLENALKNIEHLEESLINEKEANDKLQVKLQNIQQNHSFNNYSSSLPLLTDQKDMLRVENTKLKMKLSMFEKQNEDYVQQLKKNRSKYENQIEVYENTLKEFQDLISVQTKTCKEHTDHLNLTLTQLENTKMLLNETEEEKRDAIDRFEQLKLQMVADNKQQTTCLPDKMMTKLKNLSSELTKHMTDNRKMNEIIRQLTEERLRLQNRIKDMELLVHHNELNGVSLVSVNYLFKSLNKFKRYQKILIWQKRYLENLLDHYRAQIVLPLDYKCALSRFSTVNKFKSVTCAIIAIIRLKKLSNREHLMNRVQIHGEQIQLNHLDDRYALTIKKLREKNNQLVKNVNEKQYSTLNTPKYLSRLDLIKDKLHLVSEDDS